MKMTPNPPSAKDKKREELLDFFRRKGFGQSIDEIAAGLNVSKRTIFNRYKSVPNIEIEALEIWKMDLKRRIQEKFDFCNHAVEKLLFVIIELKQYHRKEALFFQRVFQSTPLQVLFLEKMVGQVILSGIERGYFNDCVDPRNYIPFYIHNVVYYITTPSSVDVVLYLLHPILSQKGHELLHDIDLQALL